MEKLIKVAIFFFFFALTTFCDCPLDLYPRKTIVGFINAEINKNPSLHNTIVNYTYMLDRELTNPSLNVAIGVVGLQFNLDQIVEFNIIYLPTRSLTTMLFNVFFLSQQFGWSLLRFNFFATQSTFFQVGSVTTNQFSGTMQNKRFMIYKPLPKIYLNNEPNSIQVKIFLNGVKIKQKSLGQQYKEMNTQFQTFKKFSNNTKLIQYFKQALENQRSTQLKITNIRTISNAYGFTIQFNSELAYLTYSYIIFSIKLTKQMHNYVSDSLSFLNNNQHKFNSIQNMDMLMTGITGFQVPSQSLYYFQLKFSDLGGKGYFLLNTNYKYFNLPISFIAFDLKLAFACQECQNSPIIYQNKLCVEQCPRSYSLSQQLGVKFCQPCDIDKLKVIDPQSGKCVCAKRHFLDLSSSSCQPCSYDCMTCDKSDRCLTCDNSLQQTKRKISNDGRCNCPLIGYYDDKNSQDIICQKCHPKCLTCSGPKQHNCLTCQPSKQRDSLGFCVCKNGFVEDLSGNCVCLPPRILNQNNLCLDFTTVCDSNQIQQFVNLIRRCICKPGYYTVMNQCIKCNQIAIFNRETLKCQCPKPTVEVNGECKNCQMNKIYNQITQMCVCQDGTYETKDGSCKICPPKMVLIGQSCECVFNYYESRPGICERCKSERDGPKCKRNIF